METTKSILNFKEWEPRYFQPDHPFVKYLNENPTFEEILFDLSDHYFFSISRRPRNALLLCGRSYVGSFTIGSYRLDFRPKIDSISLVKMFRYAFKLDSLKRLPKISLDDELGLDDILREELANQVKRLLKTGLRREYQEVNEQLDSPRGRIDFRFLAYSGGITHATLPCTWFPRISNSKLNKALLAGMLEASRATFTPLLRNTFQRLITQFKIAGIESVPLTGHLIKEAELSINRLNQSYKPALTIIRMLFELSSSLFSRYQDTQLVNGFLFDMNRFFQRLLSRFMNENLISDVHIVDEQGLYGMFQYEQIGEEKRKRIGTPRPDFAVMKGKKVITLLDAKYRDLSENHPTRDMLYQLALYAVSQVEGCREATILYPSQIQIPEYKINIREPVSGSHIASIILRPVMLSELCDLIERGSNRERWRYAHYMTLGSDK
jgi:5-methylcytosine-specific restriction enzyme subunit McrC